MSSPWQRRRHPDDVPTPVAVAVSDYCRRAQSKASARDVREALSTLNPEDDFRVRALAEGEPDAKPLGPFAFVDVLLGASPALAAQREGCGYYELARELLVEAPPSAEDSLPDRSPPPQGLPRNTPAKRQLEPARAPTVAEKIAPKKKPLAAPAPLPDAEAAAIMVSEGAPSGKRSLPRPRGRFTQLEVQKNSVVTLFEPEGAAVVRQMLEQQHHRPALLEALRVQFSGRSQPDVSSVEVDALLEHHGLLAVTLHREREALLGAYTEHRGAHGRVAWALNVRPSDLEKWVTGLGMKDEVEAVRERFRREALGTSHWTARLDLLGRTKYLADLGITQRFTDTLRKELSLQLDGILPDATDPADASHRIGRVLGVAPELVSRAFEKLGLSLTP